MKYKLTLLLLFFFQTILFSQTANYIDIKIEEKFYLGQKYPESTFDLRFDKDGKLLKRIGYKINLFPNNLRTDLVETYTYSDDGLLKIILVQEKDNTNILKARFQSKYFYNDKKQLIEMINFHYLYDSIQQKITFAYDTNGNRTRINKDESEYIIVQYDSNNKFIKSQLFKNNKYIKDIKTSNNPLFTYRDLPNLESKKLYIREAYLRKIDVGEKHLVKNETTFYENGIIKTNRNSNHSNVNLNYIYQIKFDGKTKYDKTVIEKINNEILQIENWQ